VFAARASASSTNPEAAASADRQGRSPSPARRSIDRPMMNHKKAINPTVITKEPKSASGE
jgi:hypothetical protein